MRHKLRAVARPQLSFALSLLALLVALAATPVGDAATKVVRRALFAQNAGAVNGIKASKHPVAGRLLPLGSTGQFPASVLPLDSTTKAPRIAAVVHGPRGGFTVPSGGSGFTIPFSLDLGGVDTDHLYDPAQPTRLTAPVDGFYLLMAAVGWGGDNDPAAVRGTARHAVLLVNGKDTIIGNAVAVSQAHTAQQFSGLASLKKGDYVEVVLYHDSPNPVTVPAWPATGSSLSMIWLAPPA
jgi:hypothetical protein